MHTEHLQNVSISAVVTGWLISIAVTSAAVLIGYSLGMVDASDDVILPALAIAIGFAAGGMVVGVRTSEAPILHGLGIGLLSVVAWAALNIATAPVGGAQWRALTPALTVLVILEQILAAVLGARLGYILALRSATEPPEEAAEGEAGA